MGEYTHSSTCRSSVMYSILDAVNIHDTAVCLPFSLQSPYSQLRACIIASPFGSRIKEVRGPIWVPIFPSIGPLRVVISRTLP